MTLTVKLHLPDIPVWWYEVPWSHLLAEAKPFPGEDEEFAVRDHVTNVLGGCKLRIREDFVIVRTEEGFLLKFFSRDGARSSANALNLHLSSTLPQVESSVA
ncbi:MAG: hypothetical protein WAN50_05105 [Minisyncoccia bacterium]